MKSILVLFEEPCSVRRKVIYWIRMMDKKGYVLANLYSNMNEEKVPEHICKFRECEEKQIEALEDKDNHATNKLNTNVRFEG
jgi:hypothetical protein